MDKIRTRFAPSPTGYMHIGNLRTALYEYLIAKSQGGDFILRIEDTDQERYVEGAMDVVLDTLKMTGIDYDEGPGKGGEYGPYIQSERRPIYKEYAVKLVELGQAYYCFCTKERLDSLKTGSDALGTSFNYDRHCRDLSKEEVEANLAAGIPYVIRQKMPLTGTTTFEDAVYGSITVENKTLDDQVLLKSDGLPTYNFANVVDDHLMKITHVVRGNEYLSSTPKYNLLYEAFGWEIPTYIHCAPVMKDEHNKLSKRNGDASFGDLIAKGYLPEAVLNYIALLGWSPSGNEEFYTLSELEKAFTIKGISKSPSIFDIDKLKWMNGEYIRRMSAEDFYKTAKTWIDNAVGEALSEEKKQRVAALIQPRTEILTEIDEKIFFFKELPEYSTELYCHKKMKTDTENSLTGLKLVLTALEGKTFADIEWVSQNLYEILCKIAADNEIKNSQILWPVRTALSGLAVSPGGATELAEILGYDETIRRIKIGIELLTK
ncbi:MAG: glutamate--tRNA ligase [Ruminococcaceae bacterium]|nr:glutamate--tRNA ligase [Oscillospiraceae bacterium]